MIRRAATLLCLMCAAVSWLASAPARAQSESRYALVIAAHAGLSTEVELEHAGRDANKMADVLEQLGGFLPDNVVRLIDVDATRARDALARINARIRGEREPGRATTLVVYYSGHADDRSLHLGESLLPWDELRNAVDGSSADLRLLVVDACRSGRATRVKGFRAAAPFALPIAAAARIAEGFVILSSAAEGEDAQESDAIAGSFFTHHLVSGLRGAADVDADQQVTLDEAYHYARDQTIAATSTTTIGVQHPTYRYSLKGRSNVVLTRLAPTRSHGRVALPGAGHFIVHVDRKGGPIAAEVSSPGTNALLALGPGRYFVLWREPTRFREGDFRVEANRDTRLAASTMEVFEYGRFVRKGGGAGPQLTLTLAGGVAPAVPNRYGPALGPSLGLALELEPLTVELVGAHAYAQAHDGQSSLHTFDALIGIRRAIDLSALTVSFGLRLGIAAFLQRSNLEPARQYLGPAFEALARIDVPLVGPLTLVAEGGVRVLGVEVRESWRSVESRTPVLGWARLGLGVSF